MKHSLGQMKEWLASQRKKGEKKCAIEKKWPQECGGDVGGVGKGSFVINKIFFDQG